MFESLVRVEEACGGSSFSYETELKIADYEEIREKLHVCCLLPSMLMLVRGMNEKINIHKF